MTTGGPSLPGIPGGEPAPQHRSVRLWARMVIAVVLVVALAVLAIGFVGVTVDAHGPRSSSRVGSIIGLVVTLGLLYASTRFAIRTEHRLRAGQPVAQAWATGSMAAAGTMDAASSPKPARSRAHRLRYRQYGPVGTSIFLALFAAGTVGCLAGAISMHSQAQRSSYTQNDGTSAHAAVLLVNNTQTCGRYSCTWSAAISVSLSPPVDGLSSTVVHYPGYSDLVTGERVTVLVDPKQPSYAELPGHQFMNATSWIVFLIIALLLGWLSYLEAKRLRTLLAHRRQHQGSPLPAATPAA